jgi:hypothetical protein
LGNYQEIKAIVRAYYDEMETASAETIGKVIKKHTSSDYQWFGMHPFNELKGSEEVTDVFWKPFYQAWSPIQRRQDIFMAGTSEIEGDDWVISMGNIIGLLDGKWLGFPATRKMTFFRYAEFNCVKDGKICKTGLFFDILGVLSQAGINPLPLQTGAQIIVPGPRTHDGLLFEVQEEQETVKTLDLVNLMKDDLQGYDDFFCPPNILANTWQDGMIWYGPTGIGSTYTIDRYCEQHEFPFAHGLKDLTVVGHKSRFAEGKYAGWFGWPNLTMKLAGNFMGLPSSGNQAGMRVVDIYRREEDKLAENWVFIDIPYFLYQQDLDILDRTRKIVSH